MEARRAASGGQYMADEPVRVTQGDPLSSVWATASQASHNHSSVLAATQVLARGGGGGVLDVSMVCHRHAAVVMFLVLLPSMGGVVGACCQTGK